METGLVALAQFAMQSAHRYGLIAGPQERTAWLRGINIRRAIGRQGHPAVLRCIVSGRRFLGL
jgi:hypothetical protein